MASPSRKTGAAIKGANPSRKAGGRAAQDGGDGSGLLGCSPDQRRPPEEWIEAVLRAHNTRRAWHWTPPLVWSDECFDLARRQADVCMYAAVLHGGHKESLAGDHGQNLKGPLKPKIALDEKHAEDIVNHWYLEGAKYNFNTPGPTPKAANFTQMMWSGSSSVGMALSQDGGYCVANYFPVGNQPVWNFVKYVRPQQDGAYCVANYFPVGSQPAWNFIKYVRPHQEGRPPWLVAEPDAEGSAPDDPEAAPCTAENWRKHDELSASLTKAADLRLELEADALVV